MNLLACHACFSDIHDCQPLDEGERVVAESYGVVNLNCAVCGKTSREHGEDGLNHVLIKNIKMLCTSSYEHTCVVVIGKCIDSMPDWYKKILKTEEEYLNKLETEGVGWTDWIRRRSK